MEFFTLLWKIWVIWYIGKNQNPELQGLLIQISMLDRTGSYFYKLLNFTGINMEVANAITNIE